MLRSFLLLLALLLGLNAPVALAADTPPDVLARTTTQDVLTILKQDKELQNGNMAKVYQLVEAKILPNFDFNRMTQLALGKHWPRATPKQKQALVSEFRNLLVRTYSGSLTAFTNQTVEFKPLALKPGDTDVTVRSEIRQPGGQPIPINYSMYKTAFGWKVYDVTIDGVSLVTNYRASFSNNIRQNGIDGLIKALADQSVRGAPQPAPRPGS
ncbi:MAG: ABC transporter substrate-binding protein [Thiobacillus sp.]|nr:ABC transporter substrate-binding protein [Thiobacillus sp.]